MYTLWQFGKEHRCVLFLLSLSLSVAIEFVLFSRLACVVEDEDIADGLWRFFDEPTDVTTVPEADEPVVPAPQLPPPPELVLFCKVTA